jgi:hypothetical protein
MDSPTLHSRGARDALLARLRTEKSAMIRAEVVRLLRTCYGADAAVRKATAEAIEKIQAGEKKADAP